MLHLLHAGQLFLIKLFMITVFKSGRSSVWIVFCCLWLQPVLTVFAHTDGHEMITNATREILLNPRKPELYLNRAELYRLHSSWDLSLADLARAEALSNTWHILHFSRARLLMNAGWFESAKVSADRFLELEPDHLEALVTRARTRVKLGDFLRAAEDYTHAISVAAPPTPELYLERAQALADAGPAYLNKAMQGLDEGVIKLGSIITLQLASIDLELKHNRWDAALARLDKIMAQAPRKEVWLVRRGEILRLAGKDKEAFDAYSAALKALESLPPARRRVPAIMELEARIQKALSEFQINSAIPSAPK